MMQEWNVDNFLFRMFVKKVLSHELSIPDLNEANFSTRYKSSASVVSPIRTGNQSRHINKTMIRNENNESFSKGPHKHVYNVVSITQSTECQ